MMTDTSTSSDSNAALIAAYLDAVLRKDASAVDRYFDDDVEYIVNGTYLPDPSSALPPISVACHEALPWLGLYHGREEVKKFLSHMHRNLEVTAYGPRQVVSEGSRVAAFGWFCLHALSTKRTVNIAYAIFFELRDNRIVKYHFLENTFDVAAAFHSGGGLELAIDGERRRIPFETTEST